MKYQATILDLEGNLRADYFENYMEISYTSKATGKKTVISLTPYEVQRLAYAILENYGKEPQRVTANK